jgi:hypothetical protein
MGGTTGIIPGAGMAARVKVYREKVTKDYH